MIYWSGILYSFVFIAKSLVFWHFNISLVFELKFGTCVTSCLEWSHGFNNVISYG